MSALTSVIDEKKRDIWTDPDGMSDLETLGILVAQHCDWALDGIAKVIFAALEDSNYHTLNERVTALFEDYGKEMDAIPNPFEAQS